MGTYAEIAGVEKRFGGDILVLEPWRPFLPDLRNDARIIHTVVEAEDLAAIGHLDATPRVVLEALTSMHRHGFAEPDLIDAAKWARGVRVEGHALHHHSDRGIRWRWSVSSRRLLRSGSSRTSPRTS